MTLALTWPLARRITRDIPGDFGDPLFTMWVLSWDATHLGSGWWNANIFYPHPLALAYSEHYLPQALQILPIYLLTHNPILCYNLLFVSTFVLSALGMFLFARELTGSREAAFVAGMAYAFAPYRIGALPHLQVLSGAWTPFVLLGLRRYFSTNRLRPLAGAMAAWLLQSLSCGYYFFFFSPIVVLYVVWELTTRHLWTNARVVGLVAAASAATLAVTAWFMLPYLALRQLGFKPRLLTEIQYYSADVYAYLTADPNLRLWGPIAQAWPHAEGLLFPGLTITVLALIGVGATWRRVRESSRRETGRGRLDWAASVLGWMTAGIMGLLLFLLLGHEMRLTFLKVTSFARHAWIAVMLSSALLAASPRARRTARAWLASPAGCFTVITLFAIVMSFGPAIQAKEALVTHTSLYAAFYRYVPGFDGLRVPARFGMVIALGLAALAAMGVAAMDPGRRRLGVALVSVLIAIEAAAVPIPINQNSVGYRQPGLAPLPPFVATAASLPGVYRWVAQLPASTVIAELPLGEPAFDIRYMFYSTSHWKPLVNGYSGGMPPEYEFLSQTLQDVATRPDRAWRALLDSQATHVVVHEAFYDGDGGLRISNWIRGQGGREVAAFGRDRVFALPGPP